MNAHARPIVGWILRAMMGLTALAALPAALFAGATFAGWVAAGGIACTALTLLFALRAFAVDAALDARGALGALVRAEALKLGLAAAGFVLVAMTVPDRFGPVMIGFGAALTGYWFALPLALRENQSQAPGRH